MLKDIFKNSKGKKSKSRAGVVSDGGSVAKENGVVVNGAAAPSQQVAAGSA